MCVFVCACIFIYIYVCVCDVYIDVASSQLSDVPAAAPFMSDCNGGSWRMQSSNDSFNLLKCSVCSVRTGHHI